MDRQEVKDKIWEIIKEDRAKNEEEGKIYFHGHNYLSMVDSIMVYVDLYIRDITKKLKIESIYQNRRREIVKKECDNCAHFNKKYFENHLELPCTNKKMKGKFSSHDFWQFYYWAKDMSFFSCKGFHDLTG